MAFGEHDEIGPWSVEKLDYLKRYLPYFQLACKKALQTYYIDGFAGVGLWRVEGTNQLVEGSPLLAMSVTDPRPFTKCFFVEADPQRCSMLEANLRERFPGQEHRYEVIHGQFHEVLPQILSRIHHRAPTFVFVDPSGPHHYWDSNVLLSKWKTELFINFPYQMAIQRLMPNSGDMLPEHREILNRVFGTNEWENLYRDKLSGKLRSGAAKAFIDLYCERLKALGYKLISRPQPVKNNLGNIIYYLLWVGKHRVGEEIMRHVLKRQGKQLTLGL